jgi:hypothetical protein
MLRNLKMQLASFENALSQHFGRILLLFYENTSHCEGRKDGWLMNNLGQHGPPAEPNRELVEHAIVRVLEIAQHQGITAADFIQMLDSGIRISDFLNALNVSTNAGSTIECDFLGSNPQLLD